MNLSVKQLRGTISVFWDILRKTERDTHRYISRASDAPAWLLRKTQNAIKRPLWSSHLQTYAECQGFHGWYKAQHGE